MQAITTAFYSPIFTVFFVVALGGLIGATKIRGYSIGPAGVLFSALLTGWARQFVPAAIITAHPSMLTIPKEFTDLGLVLFVFAVGLQAGPRFVSMFRARGKAFLAVGFLSVAAGALVNFALAKLLHIHPALATGLFAGSETSTPALAAARELVDSLGRDDSRLVSVGYGLAYPFSVFMVVILVQALPALLRTTPDEAAEAARKDGERMAPPLVTAAFRVTNANWNDRTVADYQAQGLSAATVSRIKREGVVYIGRPDAILKHHDVVLAVGTRDELAKLETVFGPRVPDVLADPDHDVDYDEVVVSRGEALGRVLGSLGVPDRFGVVITRVRREGLELSPSPGLEVEPGDVLRVVGRRADIKEFSQWIGGEEQRLDETNLLTFAAGIVIGALIGTLTIPYLNTRVGIGAGTFVAGLLLGHLGYLGPARVRVPSAARLLSRELGLVFFLGGAGLDAGTRIAAVFAQTGPQILLVGICVTVVTTSVALAIMVYGLRWNVLSMAGAMSATMTSAPALSAATRLSTSEAIPIAFASVYPVGILSKIILIQLLYLSLR